MVSVLYAGGMLVNEIGRDAAVLSSGGHLGGPARVITGGRLALAGLFLLYYLLRFLPARRGQAPEKSATAIVQ